MYIFKLLAKSVNEIPPVCTKVKERKNRKSDTSFLYWSSKAAVLLVLALCPPPPLRCAHTHTMLEHCLHTANA